MTPTARSRPVVRTQSDVVTWALLYGRQGRTPLNGHDRAVCRSIFDSARRRGVRLATMHVRACFRFVPVAPDDLIAA